MAQYNQQYEMKQTLTETPHVTAEPPPSPPLGYPMMMVKDTPETEGLRHQTQSRGVPISEGETAVTGCLSSIFCCCKIFNNCTTVCDCCQGLWDCCCES